MISDSEIQLDSEIQSDSETEDFPATGGRVELEGDENGKALGVYNNVDAGSILYRRAVRLREPRCARI